MILTLSTFQAKYLGAETDQVTNSGNVPLKCSKMLNVAQDMYYRQTRAPPLTCTQ